MTTRVTIDAHAGWPVEVVLIQGEPSAKQREIVEVVGPKTVRDFYIHSGQRITGIRELPLET